MHFSAMTNLKFSQIFLWQSIKTIKCFIGCTLEHFEALSRKQNIDMLLSSYSIIISWLIFPTTRKLSPASPSFLTSLCYVTNPLLKGSHRLSILICIHIRLSITVFVSFHLPKVGWKDALGSVWLGPENFLL